MKIIIGVLSLIISSLAHSGLATASSRIIYEGDKSQKSFIVANINDYPIIVQSWVDEGESDPNNVNAPFVVVPPVFRMQPEQNETIRIFFKGNQLPQDRESVYWLNLYEIPGKNIDNKNNSELNTAYLNLAMNTQLKIFYRPKILKRMSLKEIVSELRFSFDKIEGRNYLICHNPSPYNISFSKIKVITATEEIVVEQTMDMMTKSLSQKRYLLPDTIQTFTPIRLELDIIGDDGRVVPHKLNF